MLGVVAQHEDIAATDEADGTNPDLARFADGDIRREDAGDVTWSAVAIDARRRRRFIHDFRLGTPVQAPGAQLPHRRVDVIGALDMMTVQVGLDHALRGCTGIFRVASGGRKNAREKVAQAVDRDRDRFRGAHARTLRSAACQ
jgi:hypothetical protein